MRKLLITLVIMSLAALMLTAQNKAYITRVLDYSPAPGQFINKLPVYNVGEPRDSVLARALWQITGRYLYERYELLDGTVIVDSTFSVHPAYVSLGGFGGRIVFGFDHPVVNVADALDMQIFGNSFAATGSSSAGSCEPGIVMVSRDVNGNGEPDDPWYELAGSDYYKPHTYHNYTITYYRPDESHVPTPQGRYLTDTTYIRWVAMHDGLSNSGYIVRNSFNTQDYWPLWNDESTLSFTGTCLPRNSATGSGSEEYYVQSFFEWGYVDNRPDFDYDRELTDSIRDICNLGFDIDWAVDDDGQHVDLPYIDFVMVYTAMNQQLGWIGETSTEVSGAIDLHPDEPMPVVHVTGDVNDDGSVNASDMNILIDIILGRDTSGRYDASADVNGDGAVDVIDINEIINIILSGQ